MHALCPSPSLLPLSLLALPPWCHLGSHPQTSTFLGSVLILGLGLSLNTGTLFQEGWVLLCSGSDGAKQQGAVTAVSHVGLGPAGFCWQALGACTPCDVLSPWLALLFHSHGLPVAR